jgi:N-acetylglucosaminyl-diphospho-decaprenol L-rhamnosyltransferase
MKLLIVIVNYRVPQLTIDCLHSVAQEILSIPGAQVAVCENASGDDSAERIQKAIAQNGWGSWCSLTVNASNLGFTGGNNVILKPAMHSVSPPQYFLLLNPDTVVRPNALKALLEFMDQHLKVGISGCRLEAPDGLAHRSAFRFQSPASEFENNIRLGLVTRLLSRWVVAPPVRNEIFQTDWVAGACMMIRREVLRDVGFLDEDYFTYFDDCDFCFNAQRRGWSTWYVPTGTVVHLEGQSSGVTAKQARRLPPYYFEARRRYFLKNHSAFYAAMADIGQITGQALWRLRIVLTGREDTSPPNYLGDSIRQSVFMKGFKPNRVANPTPMPKEARDNF